MSTNYPSTLDSYTNHTDNIDTIMAAHVNNLQDAVEAIEGELGTDPAGASATVKARLDAMDAATHYIRGFVSNPQAVYARRAQIVLIRTESAITITRIHIHCADTSPTAELAGDLKFADDVNAGGFANATIIDVCDTKNGVKTITSGFDDATVPAGKYVYFQLDSSPHADIKDFYIEVYYTVD